MKIEIDIPQLTELNRKLEQLIDTLNDVAVMQINQCRKPVTEAAEAVEPEAQVVEPAGAKRGRKKRETAPEPEIITYGEAEVQAAAALVTEQEQQAPVAAEEPALVTEQEQPAPVAAEEPAPVPAEEETPSLPGFDLDYLRTRVTPAIASANKLPEAKQWLADHGAPTLKDLDAQHYAAFHKFACELCGVDNL
jgi:hypothetical protein